MLRILIAKIDWDWMYNIYIHRDNKCTYIYWIRSLFSYADGATVQSVIISSPSGPVFEGSEATLECRVTAQPALKEMIKWRIKGGLVRSTNPSSENTRSVLHVANVSRDLRGPVECWADNGIAGPSVMSILLNVQCKWSNKTFISLKIHVLNKVYFSYGF